MSECYWNRPLLHPILLDPYSQVTFFVGKLDIFHPLKNDD